MIYKKDIDEKSIKHIYDINRIDQIALIVLYGLGNSGKTSTLIELIKTLIGSHTASSYNWLNKRGKYADVRIIIPYNGKLIYISTKGDGRLECEENILFFRSIFDLTKIFVVFNNKVLKLSELTLSEQKQLYLDAAPDICISASRTDGGSVAAMDYHMMERLPYFRAGIWVRKMSAFPNQNLDKDLLTAMDREYANELKAHIDRLIKGELL